MANGFPCPNPTCQHVFSPEAVKGAASLTCPRCGSIFQFRPRAVGPTAPAPRPQPKPSTAQASPARVKAPPVKAPAAPAAIPVVTPVEPVSSNTAEVLAPPADFLPPSLRRRSAKAPKGKRGILLPILAGFVVVLVLGVAVWYLLSLVGSVVEPNAAPGVVQDGTRFNYHFQAPSADWKQDDRTRLDLKAPLALRRTNPNSWLVVMATDYATRTPQDAEMVDEAVRRLKAFFKDTLEWEARPEVELAGKRAQRLVFLAELKSVAMVGECYLLANQGIGYWFVTWAPAELKDAASMEWDNLRKGFTLLKERDGWSEKPPEQFTVSGSDKAPPYRLTCTKGVWEKQQEANPFDPRADVALLGRDATEPKDADKTATALVLLLPKANDLRAAVTAAKAYLVEQQKKLYPETTLEEIEGKVKSEERQPEEIGNVRGQVLRLHVKSTSDLQKLVYLAVIQRPELDHVVVLQCECDWRRRVYWEVNFTQLERKFHLKIK
jgi:hypothetical protein